jgi:adenine-specific DNA-methyltransferase
MKDDDRPPYLGSQLLAYIGNKRRLLPFLEDGFRRIGERSPVRSFLDPFAGTGSVSRLARWLGWRVSANDSEEYARIMCSCYLEIDERELGGLFLDRGGVDSVLSALNALHPERGGDPSALEAAASCEPYIARYYAPRDTARADYRTERLFYTRENAIFIDRVRTVIEAWYPAGFSSGAAEKEKTILLAALLYEASVHSNTSGVFKAYHKGFGGHGKDALVRIKSAMTLERPSLLDGRFPGEVARGDAVDFVLGRSSDLCYLDPPYNQHQYGSNYHILNTIAEWGRAPVSEDRAASGSFREKAGIPRTWMKTKSAFCSRGTAAKAFATLLDRIDTGTIAVSYNTEGIVPFEELFEMCAARGRVELLTSEYVTYRGGRQSDRRQVGNLEFLLIVDCRERTTAADREITGRFLLEKELATLMKRSFDPERIKAEFAIRGESIMVHADGMGQGFPMVSFHRFDGMIRADEIRSLSRFELKGVVERLSRCLCPGMMDEMEVLLRLMRSPSETAPTVISSELQKRYLECLGKIAFRKYAEEFAHYRDIAADLVGRSPSDYPVLEKGLPSLAARAELRMKG